MPEFGFFKPSAHDPDSKAFLDANTGEWLTRAQLSRHVTAFAERLRFPRKAFGFHFGLNDSAGLIAYLGAIESGHAIVTLDPDMDPGLKSKLIALFEPDFLIGPESHAPGNSTGYAPCDPPHAGQFLWRATTPHRHEIHPDLTLLLSTSGSTGSPKLVRLAWRNLEASARQINQALRNTERDRAMVTTPIFNAYGQSAVHTHLLAGGSFVLTRERVISREFWNTVRDSGCNSIGGTPYFYEALDRLDLDSLDVPLLTKFIATGGRLAEHLGRKYHFAAAKRGGVMHLMYGQAEATARITGLPPELLPEAARSIGFALGGKLRIELDGAPCGPMEEGELIYEHETVMMGYATRPADLALGDVLGGKLATGDLGYQDERGLFYITGRKARFVKLFGWRVSLDDVEELLSHAAPVAAVNEKDRVVIYTERNDAAFAEAVRQIAARLRIHPTGFEVRGIDSIPRLANGKVDYRSLAPGMNMRAMVITAPAASPTASFE